MDTRKKKATLKFGMLSVILFTFAVIVLFINCNDTLNYTENKGKANAYVLPYIPDTLYLCGERVPLEYVDVKESLEKEMFKNTFWHSQTIQIIKRANRYFPTIEKIFEEEGIPEDLKYIAIAESAFEFITSSAGAKGYWHFMEGTAKDYNLEVYSEVDERYHLEKSTRAAAQFLKKSYEKYNNWTLATASYNVGRRGVDRQLNKQTGDTSYYDLLFNSETARYVFRVLSYKLILESPETYGFYIPEEELYYPYKTKEITVKQTIPNLNDFAQSHGTNYKVLKILNPWLRNNKLTISQGNEYIIKLPKKNSGLWRE